MWSLRAALLVVLAFLASAQVRGGLHGAAALGVPRRNCLMPQDARYAQLGKLASSRC
jgi:hypothetical protein